MQTPELLSDPVYHDEDAARSYLERTRWPEYVHCPLCGSLEKISQLGGESMGPGWWFCGSCKEKFTVRSARSWSARISRFISGCWPSA